MLVLAHTGITLASGVLTSKVIHKECHLNKASWLALPRGGIDYRVLLVGSLLPDIIDKPVGQVLFHDTFSNGRIFCHTHPLCGVHRQGCRQWVARGLEKGEGWAGSDLRVVSSPSLHGVVCSCTPRATRRTLPGSPPGLPKAVCGSGLRSVCGAGAHPCPAFDGGTADCG